MMDDNEIRYAQQLEQQLQDANIKNLQNTNDLNKSSVFKNQDSEGIAQLQLDVTKQLDRAYHMLSCHVLKITSGGGDKWTEPEDKSLKTFSEFGVNSLMTLLTQYININTLMSNYSEEEIKDKMHRFGTDLVDEIHANASKYFYYKSAWDLFFEYSDTYTRAGVKFDDYYLFKKCEDEARAEFRSRLIRSEVRIWAIIDMVHSTYNRALNGEERESIRKQMHISQNMNNGMPQPQQAISRFSLIKPSTWGGNK